MQEITSQVLIAKTDYEVIMDCLKRGMSRSTFNRQEADALEKELKRATLVATSELPDDVVRLNSTVTISDEKKKVIKLVVVTPEKADITQRKISIASPMGAALIGMGQGQQVSWNVPAGKKTFTILDVSHSLL